MKYPVRISDFYSSVGLSDAEVSGEMKELISLTAQLINEAYQQGKLDAKTEQEGISI